MYLPDPFTLSPKISYPLYPKVPTYPLSPKVSSYPLSPKVPTYPLSPKVPTYPLSPKVPTYPLSSKVPTYPLLINTSINTKDSISQSENNDFIVPLDIHKQYGVIDIPDIQVIQIEPSNHKDKKYAITVKYQGQIRTIHYGNSNYQQFADRTPIKAFSFADHNDWQRRRSYLARSSKITNSQGLAANDPFSANRYSIITLW